MIFRLFSAVLLILCGAGWAHAEYILRLPNFPEIRFEDAEVENIQPPLGIGNRPGEQDWTQKIEPRKPDSKDKNYPSKENWDDALSRRWSRIYPRERVSIELTLPHFAPEPASGDHIWIFYTTYTGVLVANGKEIFFPYSQIFIDKHYFGFMDAYRHCLHDITPPNWSKDEPRLYGSIPMVIRGVLDRLETDEPFLWEGWLDSVRFMDVYLRDIEVLKIDCK